MVGAMTGLRTSAVEAKPITDADTWTVAEFFHRQMGSSRNTVADWQRLMIPPGDVEQPNHGYFLRENEQVVGAYLALYSERMIDGRVRSICNLGAWCVVPEHRGNGLRLLRSLLRQRGYTFTDLTPSETVVALNTRLGFVPLDTTTVMIPNTPWPLSRGARVVDAPNEIDRLLSEKDQTIYRDHVGTAAHHAVLVKGDQVCYVMFRRDRRRRLPLFAFILYVGNPGLFHECASHLYRYLLLRHRMIGTLAEIRIVGHRPKRGIRVSPLSKMYLSEDLGPAHIDYLYSELTCRPW
jgi:hypothetical protein